MLNGPQTMAGPTQCIYGKMWQDVTICIKCCCPNLRHVTLLRWLWLKSGQGGSKLEDKYEEGFELRSVIIHIVQAYTFLVSSTFGSVDFY